METLRKSSGTIGLDATQSRQREKSVRGKPLFGSLRRKRIENIFYFPLARGAVQPKKNVWYSQVTIVLRDLVFQDQVIAKCVPGQFTDHPVILMQIVAIVGQNQVGRKRFLQLFKFALDLRLLRREKGVAIIANHHFLFLRCREEQIRGPCRFFPADWSRAEHHPINFYLGTLAQQPQNRSAAPDLNVVAV